MRVSLFGLFLQRTNLTIGNVGLYNWFSCSYFTYCLISCFYVLIFTIHLSCTHVPGMHATWHYHMYSRGCTLDFHVQIVETGPWCHAVADQSAQRILPWRSEYSRSSDLAVTLPPSSSPVWLPISSCYSWAPFSFCISFHVLYFSTF